MMQMAYAYLPGPKIQLTTCRQLVEGSVFDDLSQCLVQEARAPFLDHQRDTQKNVVEQFRKKMKREDPRMAKGVSEVIMGRDLKYLNSYCFAADTDDHCS